MFNAALLSSEVQDFIKNFKGDITSLAFSGSPFSEVSTQELMTQISGRNRIEKKLLEWFHTNNIIYPPQLNLEQTSSEQTAEYKASLVSGKTLADITGGFGVDSFYFSEKFEQIFHFETNTELSHLAKHNFRIFGKSNIHCLNTDGLRGIEEKTYDVIYADPSRRDATKGKVFYLKDCEPNIPEVLDSLLSQGSKLMIKTSPMLDLSIGIEELRYVTEIHIVAVKNDVKELIWIVDRTKTEEISIHTINFEGNHKQQFSFTRSKAGSPTYSNPQKFLYEPNAAIFKSGAFNLISEEFRIHKLHSNTHLYTAEELIDFPGRRFRITDYLPYTKSEMRKLRIPKANIAIRNFPESVETLRKKWKIKSGGSIYMFFITNWDGKKEVLVCEKKD